LCYSTVSCEDAGIFGQYYQTRTGTLAAPANFIVSAQFIGFSSNGYSVFIVGICTLTIRNTEDFIIVILIKENLLPWTSDNGGSENSRFFSN